MNPLMDALSAAGYILDTPGAYTRGLFAGSPGERVDGREMLQSLGLVGENDESQWDAGDFLGIGAEILFDPLNLIGVGLIADVPRAAKATQAANAASEVMRAKGYMPEEVARATKLRTGGDPTKFYHGTPFAFDEFSMADVGKRDSKFGEAVYFSDNPEYASMYSQADDASNLGVYKDWSSPEGPPSWAVDVVKRNENGYDPTFIEEIKNKRMPGTPIEDIIDDADIIIDMARKKVSGFNATQPMSADQKNQLISGMLSRNFAGSTQEEISRSVGSFAPNVKMAYIDSRKPFNLFRELSDLADMKKRPSQSPLAGIIPEQITGDNVDELFEPRDYVSHLRNKGYDSFSIPGTDESMTVPFSVDQIYKPFIAPKIREIPTYTKPIMGMVGYNAIARQQ